jgi:hypothetical protein
MERGSYTELGCKDRNRSRLKNASRKNGEKYRMRRKFLRGDKKRVREVKIKIMTVCHMEQEVFNVYIKLVLSYLFCNTCSLYEHGI